MQSIDTRYTLNMEGSAHTLEDTLWELETGLRELYGARYRGLVLYGSYARGDADEGSDIDLLLLLAGPVESGTEIRRASELVSRLSLDSDRVLSVIPVDTRDYQTSREPYLENVRREGMLASPGVGQANPEGVARSHSLRIFTAPSESDPGTGPIWSYMITKKF